jgi:ribosomal protein S18 acetylase RimI-like enzyme
MRLKTHAFRRQGLGRHMIHALAFGRKNVTRIRLTVVTKANVAANALHFPRMTLWISLSYPSEA